MNDDPDTSVLKDFVNGRLSLEKLSSVQNYLNSNPDALNRLDAIEDDSFVKAFREGIRSPSRISERDLFTSTRKANDRVEIPLIKNYRFVSRIKKHDLVSTWTAWLSPSEPNSVEHSHQKVVVKVFHSTDCIASEDLERFRREAETLRKLDHPNIVRYIDSSGTSQCSYLTMEFLDGVDLSRLIASQGSLSAGAVAAIAIQILQALNYLHEQKIIHRDIKPSNIMLCRDGFVRLIDFGLARPNSEAADHSLRRSEQFLGTIDYVSPEQAMEPTSADIRSDLYSLGCTLFKLLTGKAPFSTQNYDNPLKKVVAHALAQPPKLKNLRPDLQDEFCHCIEKLLAKNPADRFQAPAEAIVAFTPWLSIEEVSAINQSIGPLVQQRNGDLWKINPETTETQSKPLARLRIDLGSLLTNRATVLFGIVFLSIAVMGLLLFGTPDDWLSRFNREDQPISTESALALIPVGKDHGTSLMGQATGQRKAYLREGYYRSIERNLRNKVEQGAGIIISDDVFAYTTADNEPPGRFRRVGCLWTRFHNHELEKEGKFVYVEQPAVSGYLILEAVSETEFKATCWRGTDFTLGEAIKGPNVGYFHSTIEGKWWSNDTLFIGTGSQLNKEIADDWFGVLSKYAPRCVPNEKRLK